jgi:hypothetical protein
MNFRKVFDNFCNQCRSDANPPPLKRLPGESSKDMYRRRHFEKTYGISLETYNRMLDRQSGGCAVCGITPENITSGVLKTTLAVDHNHTTNKVRGLLCFHCNIAIGHARDSIDTLLRMVDYLKLYENQPESE